MIRPKPKKICPILFLGKKGKKKQNTTQKQKQNKKINTTTMRKKVSFINSSARFKPRHGLKKEKTPWTQLE